MNYDELKAAVKAYLEVDETTFNTYYDTFLQTAETDIYRQVQMPFATELETSTFVTGNRFHTLPPDFLSAYYFAIIADDGSYNFLLPKDHSLVNEIMTNTLGMPRYYTIFDQDKLIYAPSPDADYDMEMSYFRVPPTLSTVAPADGTQTNWLLEFGETALLFGTIIQGYVFLKGDQDVIAAYTNQYQSALASLKIITEGRQQRDSNRMPERRMPS